MTSYKNFIGIDIGKFNFVANLNQSKTVSEYANTPAGIASFLKDFKKELPVSLCILETTGGHEMQLLLILCDKQYAVHRANTRKVKHFICSYGNKAKTDKLDATALSQYGQERHRDLALYTPSSKQAMALFELVSRRHDLRKMIVAEKNRLQSPCIDTVKTSCETLIKVLSSELEVVTNKISKLIAEDEVLSRKKEVLKSISGIGEIIANELLVLLPELGELTRREVAALCGVAPKANDSGKYRGYRSTGHGRAGIKPNLFLAAMAARNSKTALKTFYEQLVGRGKKKKVALTALMRKIITIANAKIKELNATAKIVRAYCN